MAKKKVVKKSKKAKSVKKAAKRAAPKKQAKAVKTTRALINLKVESKDRKAIEARALKFAKGNVSAWLRYAGSKFTPPKNAVIE